MSLHIFGIRHHGPGSARSLLHALDALQPDIVLVEGPPDAEGILSLLVHPDMEPPVALLVYAVDNPKKAAYYPFAVFSPEWQALRYALLADIPVQFMDLPMRYQRGQDESAQATGEPVHQDKSALRYDPLGELAKAAGYEDGERWWEHMVEHRRDSTDLFEAVLEAMSALRDSTGLPLNVTDAQCEQRREAYMRQTIRTAQQAYNKIAIVCGAWHGPALTEPDCYLQQDAELLFDLPAIDVVATWIPWTHSRLSMFSGYGAGIWSPGWYQHVWESQSDITTGWLTKVAHLLRQEDIQASTAQIIDAVRLAETLAAMRDISLPGLEELNAATRAVYCFGNDKPLELISRKLIIGDVMGSVPDDTPMVPIQRDLTREQKRLGLRPEAGESNLNLDLRVMQHLERSQLLHRLSLLGVTWGEKVDPAAKRGTFREVWKLNWRPELTIVLIERSV